MRELLKIDVAAEKISRLFKDGRKITRIVKTIAFVWTVFNIIAVIWSLIPKSEKLGEVSGDELINAVNEAQEKDEPVAEPVTV